MSGHPVALRPAERLARSTPTEITDARRSVAAVLAAAAELVHWLPAGAPDADPVWALARRLAALPASPSPAPDRASLAVADAAFRAALLASVDAIRMCRQTLHVSGACWFADEAGADGCGQVLRTAHALS